MKVGITGHQNIKIYDIEWIDNAIRSNLIHYKCSYGFSSLAVGVDQLFALLLLKARIPYTAIIPCSNYETTFKSKKEKVAYIEYIQKAKETIVLDYESPSEMAFYEAGKNIVDRSDFMFAVWDGEKAKGLGGTADIVEYGLFLGKQILHINPLTKTKKLMK